MDDIDLFRKQLRFRAWHRGTREADLVLGPFAERYLPTFGAAELQQFETFLAQEDPDIFNWLTGQAEPPAPVNGTVYRQIMQFIAERAA